MFNIIHSKPPFNKTAPKKIGTNFLFLHLPLVLAFWVKPSLLPLFLVCTPLQTFSRTFSCILHTFWTHTACWHYLREVYRHIPTAPPPLRTKKKRSATHHTTGMILKAVQGIQQHSDCGLAISIPNLHLEPSCISFLNVSAWTTWL